ATIYFSFICARYSLTGLESNAIQREPHLTFFSDATLFCSHNSMSTACFYIRNMIIISKQTTLVPVNEKVSFVVFFCFDADYQDVL
ncbi:hypothetical protein SETIT_4G234200v2, partial [Setaria italica]